MNSITKKLFSIILCLVISLNVVSTAGAAPSRDKGKVKFLSSVAIIEAESEEKANEILTLLKTPENGGFEGMVSLDLNEGGNTKVYLAYKSSTNVDDAITDISVMNMNGDYTIGNYEQLLNNTLNEYITIAKDYRAMSLEFKANYEAGKVGAVTAHRQMNYYYIEKDGVKTYMGDYILNFPEDVTEFAKMIFNGNINVILNLRSLMSMGIGDMDVTLSDRISQKYLEATTDASIYSNASYEETALQLLKQLEDMKKDINNLPLELEKIEKDSELDEETKTDLKTLTEENLNTAKAFYELLKEIPMDNTNLGDYVMNSAVIEAKKLFPIVASATPAETLMMKYNSFYTLLLYDVLEKGGDAINEILADFEKEYEPISVYHGVQNDLTSGSIGVTGKAELVSSSTGKSFISGQGSDTLTTLKSVGFQVLGAGGIASMAGGIIYLGVKKAAANLEYATLKQCVAVATENFKKAEYALKDMMEWYAGYHGVIPESDIHMIGAKQLQELADNLQSAGRELEVANANLATGGKLTNAQIFAGGFAIVLGAIMMGVSIWQLVKINNQYEPNYTEIPNNMVDVVYNEDFGDRFINYKNVPSYYMNDGKMVSRENDLNAYNGAQWVSMYYTKNYEAGYCLTTTADLIAEESVRSGYKGIHLFDHTSNYNLNSYSNRNGAEAVYLAFKYSTEKKSADTDVPEVVGSMFSGGLWLLSGGIGALIGIGITVATQKIVKKKKKEA